MKHFSVPSRLVSIKKKHKQARERERDTCCEKNVPERRTRHLAVGTREEHVGRDFGKV
jgi:hypothetical protein